MNKSDNHYDEAGHIECNCKNYIGIDKISPGVEVFHVFFDGTMGFGYTKILTDIDNIDNDTIIVYPLFEKQDPGELTENNINNSSRQIESGNLLLTFASVNSIDSFISVLQELKNKKYDKKHINY